MDMVSECDLVEIDTTGTGFKREACDPPQSVVLACPKNPLRRHEGTAQSDLNMQDRPRGSLAGEGQHQETMKGTNTLMVPSNERQQVTIDAMVGMVNLSEFGDDI
uniref:Uncharacterized protein n=1 Tax=Musa balbisiana TaxID=52838 RepID=Q1EP30_MUSBA|nr:hypothetical protein MBP_91N22.46 [Musa balbisiana]